MFVCSKVLERLIQKSGFFVDLDYFSVALPITKRQPVHIIKVVHLFSLHSDKLILARLSVNLQIAHLMILRTSQRYALNLS